ncbi:helix-turn-helix domain-containing protein [Kineococcus gypseus]|uniref:helix-turn-helix domain-containing protein n=1 Tax=Kineococcus gypseus TaxID=1637102 RepID=UPI003D7C4DA6
MGRVALVLDTSVLPPRERAAAFHAVLGAASVPTEVRHGTDPGDVRTRARLTRLGRCDVFSTAGTAFSLHRTARHVRRHPSSVVALALQRAGRSRLDQGSVGRVELAPGQVFVTDLTEPYEYVQTGAGDVLAFQLDVDALGVPVERLRRAAPLLARSPLHPVVRHHLALLEPAAEQVDGSAAAEALGESTLLLFRALVDSVGAGDPRPALADVLFERVRWYVRRHLSDPGLCAAQVAAAHHVSVRHLYAVLAAHGVALRPWLLQQRLAGAREELARPGGRPIAAVARAWGFADPGHFSRRFREAHGTTPGEWRRAHAAGGAGAVGAPGAPGAALAVSGARAGRAPRRAPSRGR